MGASETADVRIGFDRRVRLEFHGSRISSDGGLLLFRELDVDNLGNVGSKLPCGKYYGQFRQAGFYRARSFDRKPDAQG